MSKFILLPLLFLVTSTIAQATQSQGPTEADYKAMSDAIQSKDGLALLVHGIDKDNKSYVLTWRDQHNFFKYVMLPMTGTNPEANQSIAAIQRNDQVRVWGSFDLFLKSSQRHLDIDNLVVEKSFFNACKEYGLPPYVHKTKVPEELIRQSEIVAMVHGVANGGASLEIQYGDANVPVIVPEPARVQGLYKGDIVKLQYTLIYPPNGPVHMKLKNGQEAVQVLRAITSVNPPDQDPDDNDSTPPPPTDDAPTRCGPLVLYKESPTITSNVFAVKMPQINGYDWTFTLFNVDPDAFAKIREKVQAIWDAHLETAQCGRNFVWNPNIRICAKGPGNDMDASQANPQIMVNSADGITVEIISK